MLAGIFVYFVSFSLKKYKQYKKKIKRRGKIYGMDVGEEELIKKHSKLLSILFKDQLECNSTKSSYCINNVSVRIKITPENGGHRF